MPDLRFVVLDHDHPFPHFDLMLDRGASLTTWRIRGRVERGRALHAERLGDHRREYLGYEGPLSGDRGRVRRVAAGTYEPVAWSESYLAVRLDGPESGDWKGLLVLAKQADGSWRAYLSRILAGGATGGAKLPPVKSADDGGAAAQPVTI